jgi:DNA-binding PadR family transcriptional regulator
MQEADMQKPTPGDPSLLLPLKPDVFLILSILAQEERHGYSIMQAAEEWPGGGMEIQAGALYRRLKWMKEEGLIQEVHPAGVDSPEQDRRRCYGVTSFGRRVAAEEARRMGELLLAARKANLLTGSSGTGGA